MGHSREFRLDWLEVDIPTQEGAWEPCENELHIIRMLGQYWLGTGIPAGRFFRAVGLCVCFGRGQYWMKLLANQYGTLQFDSIQLHGDVLPCPADCLLMLLAILSTS